ALLRHVSEGGAALISAQRFYGTFSDTLKITTADILWKQGQIFNQRETAYLHFINPSLDTSMYFYYRRDNVYNYFNRVDTTRATVLARNDLGNPVSLLVKW